MRRVLIRIPSVLYKELAAVAHSAARTAGGNYTPELWATEVLTSELASRRLPRVPEGSHGPRVTCPVKV
jgi:hypothetical protein